VFHGLRRSPRTTGTAERRRLATVFRRALRPLAVALVTGTPDPVPPRPAWLNPRTPRLLAVLPFRTLDLVQIADVALAVILYINVQGLSAVPHREVDDQGIWFMAFAHSAPLALRQRWPLAAWRLAVLGILLAGPITTRFGDLPYSNASMIMYLLCVYTVAARCERDVSIGVWLVTFLCAWPLHPDTLFQAVFFTTLVVLFGYNVRVRRSATSRLVVEEERAERERARRAVLAERARIARELHDIVAHHMSVIAIQAEAVPLRARGDSGQLEAGLAEIRELSLKALAEMRRVLGVLRDESGVRDTAPQPGLEALDELLETSRAAGLNVSLYVTGALTDLPEAVSLSAYRIVQESLSNAMRHAPGASVTIRVERLPGELRLRAANGPARPGLAVPAEGRDGEADRHTADDERTGAPGGAGGGQGLVGMRERAAMLGGTLEAGPTDDGGFVVSATLPITEGR